MGSGPQYREPSERVKGRSTGSPYSDPSVRMIPKATSGDKEKPVHITVVRAKPIVSADRPKHVSVQRALT